MSFVMLLQSSSSAEASRPISFFDGCRRLSTVELPETLEVISTAAFSECVLLTEILADTSGITHVGTGAFAGCRELTTVIFGSEDTQIASGAYYGCDAITQIVIPEGVTFIGASAFANCVSLESITFPDTVEYIDSGAFVSCARLVQITLPSSLLSIGDGAFSQCSRLVSIEIPDSVVYVGSGAFSGTRWLRNADEEFLVVGDGVLVQYTGNSANITIPETVKRIHDYLFADVTAEISTITIPSSVEYISKEAFAKRVSSSDSSSYEMRYFTIIGRKGSYAEAYADHEYYTFRELGT